jgi:phosphoglycolate phosphatase
LLVIRLALFDIDGTLIRTGGAGVKAFERTFALEFGIPQATRDVRFAGRTDSSLVRECFGLHQIAPTPRNFSRFFDTYVFLLQHLLAVTPGTACAGVLDFILDLQALSHPPLIGLLTGNIRLGAEIKLRHYDLWHWFQSGAFGDDDEDRNRLAAVALQRGEKLLGQRLSGDEILVVGDTPADVACAKSINARMLAVGTGGYSCAELRACAPTWVVDCLTDLRARDLCVGGTLESA